MFNKTFFFLIILFLSQFMTYGQVSHFSKAYADSCYIAGINQYGMGNYRNSITLFEECQNVNDVVNRDPPFYSSNALSWEASAYFLMGDTITAHELSDDYMLSPVDQRLTTESDSLYALANIYFEIDSLEKGFAIYNHAIISEKKNLGDDHYYVGYSYTNLALLYDDLSNQDSTIFYANKAIDILNNYFDKSKNDYYESSLLVLAGAYHNKALDCNEHNNIEKAQFYCEKAIGVLESHGFLNNNLYAECKHDMGILSYKLNDFTSFVSNMQSAIHIKSVNESDSESYYWSIECFAIGLQEYGENLVKQESKEAIGVLEKAVSYWQIIPNYEHRKEYHSALNNLAVAYRDVMIERSVEISEELLDLKRMLNYSDSIILLSNLADFYSEYEDDTNLTRALYYNNIVLNYREHVLNKYDYDIVITLQRMAKIYSRIKNYKEAISYIERARDLTIQLKGKESEEYARLTQNAGLYYTLSGDKETGFSYYKQAYNNSNGNKIDNAINIAAYYSETNNADSCFYYVSFAWKSIVKTIVRDFDNLSEENRFNYAITDRTFELLYLPLTYLHLFPNNPSFNKLAYDCLLYNKNLFTHLSEKEYAAEKELSYSWEHVNSYLKQNEIALELWDDKREPLNAGNIIALILRKEWDFPKVIFLSKENIYNTFIGKEDMSNGKLPLFDYIWKDILAVSQIKEGERIYISFDDFLAQYPVESILDYNLQYISDRYDIIRVSTTENIQKINKEALYPSIVLYGGLDYELKQDVIMDEINSNYPEHRRNIDNIYVSGSDRQKMHPEPHYLPLSKMEVDSIFYILKESGITSALLLYEGENGVEETIKAMSGNSPSILHIATHGLFLKPDDDEMSVYDYYSYCMNNSGLLFSGCINSSEIDRNSTKIEDGVLSSKEIIHLNLSNTDLVVLSACKTGVGGVTPYGLAGLQRAFKVAGVRTILMALNNVDDAATYVMMTTFYKALAKGASKRDAFKLGIDTLRKSREFSSFNYWAYFVMID